MVKQYGIIEGVTDRGYFTNSHHVSVWREISIYDKLKIESRYTKYAQAGCITYVELDAAIMNNHKAIEDIVDYAFSLDIPYIAFNFPIDNCKDCGFSGEIEELCPSCKSSSISRLRRVTGYLSTSIEKFNEGKIRECMDRVKHSKFTKNLEILELKGK